MKKLLFLITVITIFSFSCSIEDLFEQPSIKVLGIELGENPGEYTDLDVKIQVINNDSRDAFITDVEYTVVIEGFKSQKHYSDIDKKLNDKLTLTLPLTLKTIDAVQLLTRLNNGETLEYKIDGVFNVEKDADFLDDLPLDIEGTTNVDVGYDDFYEQPSVTVNSMGYTYTINGLTSYTFEFDVDCDVTNNDTRSVVIDEVEYVVYIEGAESEKHLYSDTYVDNLAIDGSSSVNLNLPVTLNVGVIDGAALLTSVGDGYANYVIEGTFHAIEVDGSAYEITLPLYVTGSVPISEVTK